MLLLQIVVPVLGRDGRRSIGQSTQQARASGYTHRATGFPLTGRNNMRHVADQAGGPVAMLYLQGHGHLAATLTADVEDLVRERLERDRE